MYYECICTITVATLTGIYTDSWPLATHMVNACFHKSEFGQRQTQHSSASENIVHWVNFLKKSFQDEEDIRQG